MSGTVRDFERWEDEQRFKAAMESWSIADSIMLEGFRKELAARHCRFEALHDAWRRAAGLPAVTRVHCDNGRTVCLP